MVMDSGFRPTVAEFKTKVIWFGIMANILVAEDERDIRELINFTLMFAGHNVTLAANGAEAVELAKAAQVKPDLIMMDVRMPKMTGYEACRQMKTIDDLKDIPVVFLSAKGQDEEVQTGIEAGAIAYILKPFAPEDLTRRLTEILQQIGAA
jgi:CheY-like chemotaxis protein